MEKSLVIRILVTWFLFIPVPVINGLLREKWYKPIIGTTAAHQVGSLVVSLMFLLYVYVSFRGRISGFSTTQLLAMGVIWLVLTLIFEFGIGLAAGRSWSYMLADYNVLAGRVWPFVLVVIFLSPLIIRKLVG